jgi:hypothetical protein
VQVTLLASGLLIYHGPTAGMVPWLSGQLGYSYAPASHGLASDWALDLVVVEFAKPGVRLLNNLSFGAFLTAFPL